ncbi:helix-turn-helix transcriptional regulator [Pseudoroseicyclus tamaricis]|uniref:HTH domain-containing protein n=1 Tax=Pseudoroseicyclus tamaricis TaxID=2705421 RepID=A0A6B2JW69_9RHOB|nr:HTH domain-containing protein [Pseudoroseicyclus tamaricis]NDV02747.1 HTH domain-containing protein [Pseudoroseicyclus tamaricis]
MARADRLLRLLDLMRRLRPPVTAARLAEELGLSERSIYRDIAALRAAGARIEGEAGYGYTLTEDPALPPQMFDRLEVEAVALGLAEIRAWGDAELAEAAERAMAKIVATLPERVQRQAMHHVLHAYRYFQRPEAPPWMGLLREAAWAEEAVRLAYVDRGGAATERVVYPLGLVFSEDRHQLLAWCCLREGFRRFNLHQIETAAREGLSFRPRRVSLLNEYLGQMGGEERGEPG